MEPMKSFAMILSLAPPPATQPATRPAELKLKPGDRMVIGIEGLGVQHQVVRRDR